MIDAAARAGSSGLLAATGEIAAHPAAR